MIYSSFSTCFLPIIYTTDPKPRRSPRTRFYESTFASGLRSEYSSPPRSTLAGSDGKPVHGRISHAIKVDSCGHTTRRPALAICGERAGPRDLGNCPEDRASPVLQTSMVLCAALHSWPPKVPTPLRRVERQSPGCRFAAGHCAARVRRARPSRACGSRCLTSQDASPFIGCIPAVSGGWPEKSPP